MACTKANTTKMAVLAPSVRSASRAVAGAPLSALTSARVLNWNSSATVKAEPIQSSTQKMYDAKFGP